MDANRLIIDECRAAMRTLPERCVQCCVTSPPYWGLRDYGIAPVEWENGPPCVFGLEPTPELFVQHAVEVFREVRRILRDDGVLFLNLGDSYAQDTKWGGQTSGKHAKGLHGTTGIGRNRTTSGRKAGEMCNMPHRVAEALSADGWYWRSTIIWHKRSPMPESISGWRWVRCRVKVGEAPVPHAGWETNDRTSHNGGSSVFSGRTPKWQPCPGCPKCTPNGGYVLRRGKWRPTTAHEYIFMLSKSERYFCDGDAVAEIAACAGLDRQSKVRGEFNGKNQLPGKEAFRAITETRNPRSVWTLSSEPYKGSHFATFPTMLVKRCIEAGTSAGGCCPSCASPLAPVVESERIPTRPALNNKIWKHTESGDVIQQRSQSAPNLDPQRHIAVTRITGYRPTCSCVFDQPVGCVVFDPFTGSGTTAQVARALGRQWLGSEINPEYAKLAEVRIATEPKWKGAKPKKKRQVDRQERMLF